MVNEKKTWIVYSIDLLKNDSRKIKNFKGNFKYYTYSN